MRLRAIHESAGRHVERQEPEGIRLMERRERRNHCAAAADAAILPDSAQTKTFVVQTADCADGRDDAAQRMPSSSGREQWRAAGKCAATGECKFRVACEFGSERQSGVARSSSADSQRGPAHRVSSRTVPVRCWKQVGGGAHGVARCGTKADGRGVQEHC